MGHGEDPDAARLAIAQVPSGQLPIGNRTSVQLSMERRTPATDAVLVTAPAPIIPPGSVATGRVGYHDLKRIGRGGFGEVYYGVMHGSTKPFALKRALLQPHAKAKAALNIEQYLQHQNRKLDSLQKEAEVYFPPYL